MGKLFLTIRSNREHNFIIVTQHDFFHSPPCLSHPPLAAISQIWNHCYFITPLVILQPPWVVIQMVLSQTKQ